MKSLNGSWRISPDGIRSAGQKRSTMDRYASADSEFSDWEFPACQPQAEVEELWSDVSYIRNTWKRDYCPNCGQVIAHDHWYDDKWNLNNRLRDHTRWIDGKPQHCPGTEVTSEPS